MRSALCVSTTDTYAAHPEYPLYSCLRYRRHRSYHHHPPVPITAYRDSFGNWCSRIVAPPGEMRISTHAIINDSGLPNPVDTRALQHSAEDLPAETLMFLLGSRYCETDRLSETAWALFGDAPPGGSRVQAICDFVHAHTTFGYQHARVTLGISGFPLRRTRWIFRLVRGVPRGTLAYLRST